MTKRTAAKVFFALLVLLLIVYAVDVLLLVFAAVLLAVLLRALAEPLAKWLHISPQWALAIVALLLTASIGAVGWLLAPSIGEQVRELRAALPAALERLQQELSRFVWLESVLDITRSPESLTAQPEVASKVGSAVSGTLKSLANIVLVLVIAMYLA
ncbi:MAG: AI-2E family transporter, partial [Pseudomonadota bacterium]|nr:AI-2E family transporter [Pseudomonadota bacterium]